MRLRPSGPGSLVQVPQGTGIGFPRWLTGMCRSYGAGTSMGQSGHSRAKN